MRILVVLCFASLLLQACKNDKYFDLDDAHKIIFSQGDTLVYNSNKENIARYKILKIWEGECFETQGSGETAPFDYKEFQNIYIDSLGVETSDALLSEFSQMSTSFYCHFEPNEECISILNIAKWFNVNITWYDKMDRMGFQVDEIADNITILEQNFKDVLIYRTDTTKVDVSDDQIIAWYYTYKRSIVGFAYKNGEVFELQKE